MLVVKVDTEKLQKTLNSARDFLLSEVSSDGSWKGRLSSSPLSTAIASFALMMAGEKETARRGLRWLADNINEDGGWGDTPESPSNLTTTLLSWCALSNAEQFEGTLESAEAWLAERVGGLEPNRISKAILEHYGGDRTFSVPILTMCALAGKLGEAREAWRRVPQLPFELAVLPHSFFKWIRLPVVSYALPALIAIGLVRHRGLPTWFWPWRVLRNMLAGKALGVLNRIQPESGGFLEATPLTGFVCMSLIAAGCRDNDATRSCIDFLKSSIRNDGSWPIDTNLSMWLTCLSVRALGEGTGQTQRYILDSQLKDVHPFTQATSGGWAWTDLSGGVPDADDTSAALIALRCFSEDDEESRSAAASGIEWLLDLQNRDGGMPTFCKGWGKLLFDRSCPDITAHAIRAFVEWSDDLDEALKKRVSMATEKALNYLKRVQRDDGAWLPLWFGNQHEASHLNPTYGTARVLDALAKLDKGTFPHAAAIIDKGRQWLLSAQNSDGGWGAGKGTPSSIEETALAVLALTQLGDCDVAETGAQWLIQATSQGTTFSAAPIGLYFASLWYCEKLYPVIFTVEALAALLPK